MRRMLAVAGAAALIPLVFLLRYTPAQETPGPAGSPAATVFVTLGLKAQAAERWDGSVQITGGTLARAEGWHFSAGDEISGSGTWKCVTRRDAVEPFSDVHYTEMRPGSKPPVLFQPVGLYLTVQSNGDPRFAIRTAQGQFDFLLSEIGGNPRSFLDGRVIVARVPTVEKLSDPAFEHDEAALAALPDGTLAAAWVAYRDRADRVLLRLRRQGAWSAAEEVTPRHGEIFRCAAAADTSGSLWVFWGQREGAQWQIWGRAKHNGAWRTPELLAGAGSNTFLRAASIGSGPIFLVWQSYRGGQSDIYLKSYDQGRWSEEVRVSESAANDWEPAVAAGPDGTAYVVWDSYDRGNYDIFFRSYKQGSLSPVRAITTSPDFQAHAAVTVDAENRPWVAWDESGVNWAKDQGFLIPTPLAVPIHQRRWLRLAVLENGRWLEPRRSPRTTLPESMRENAEHPQIAFDGKGTLTLLFRHWTRRNSRTIGSPIDWENYLTRFDGSRWSEPQPVPDSAGSIEKLPALARARDGALWAAWMTDGRLFRNQIPVHADIYCATLGVAQTPQFSPLAFEPFSEPFAEAIPVHPQETADVRAIRGYQIQAGGRQFHIYRGDMHRHTDVSQDFKYDGSLLELYRYALDAAAFDYIAATDHQTGYDQEFTWWQNQKLAELFLVPDRFTPLFGSERSLPYPNGHRNVIFAHPGVRPLPIPPEEMSGRVGAAGLYEYLHKNQGISMPHSTATDQGTDWRDNDPVVEPLMEIYQGYRNSYEYEGAPRAATALNPQAQKSGWQPAGFWWNALAKGYKLGVQSSSDHWSTHISYACLLAEQFTREGLLDAIRKRHAYGATDNIILDFRARSGGSVHLMGDIFTAPGAPQFSVRVLGTGPILQIDLIKDRRFVYTTRPLTKDAAFEFADREFGGKESYYYVRVLQQDGQLAWSSPMWITPGR
ncbi:MAG TPA: hypothetical protein VFA33_10990 [Bryobacteraceae bacterium]|nr:hypothetical protein [Bryobacteraceae bacterium]